MNKFDGPDGYFRRRNFGKPAPQGVNPERQADRHFRGGQTHEDRKLRRWKMIEEHRHERTMQGTAFGRGFRTFVLIGLAAAAAAFAVQRMDAAKGFGESTAPTRSNADGDGRTNAQESGGGQREAREEEPTFTLEIGTEGVRELEAPGNQNRLNHVVLVPEDREGVVRDLVLERRPEIARLIESVEDITGMELTIDKNGDGIVSVPIEQGRTVDVALPEDIKQDSDGSVFVATISEINRQTGREVNETVSWALTGSDFGDERIGTSGQRRWFYPDPSERDENRGDSSRAPRIVPLDPHFERRDLERGNDMHETST